ncbi:hypothetical protein LTR91_012028 [Friedmanniomyces endolithicus]|uniref:Methyltransferase domain-containing protein n=1 Tax=Friedmanniomyces endolithicus TaxID=329885 RepID=A0AAN6QR43_9PEZI|nr:hypothetical protein LTR94_006612 [Friedmanniomyces endolithicus]KAK0795133.1 hypothetical protein LTR59_007527 [Friedmanniomyces endolithicus]KAK0802011.1 hypothetical protein LTR38_006585 [Friedmanniomyces endolithicus]KAK0820738.1 hypothetical protein LTR75_001323 [Friedmanniomyces endolithicus]KAK0846557.1 hypothetical protein LTR03_006834 [Friedmanniomyces endolithicus]
MASAASNLRAAAASSDKNSRNNGNARFNDEALSWDSRPFVHEASQAAATAILARLNHNNNANNNHSQTKHLQVLEIGCGTGILSFLLAPHVARIVAVDAAEGMIAVLSQKLQTTPNAPQNIVPVAVLLEDPEDPVLPPAHSDQPGERRQKFDLVTSHLVLHHIPDLRAVLQTMLGCLVPGGRVMLTDFEDFGPEAKRFHPVARMAGVERHGIQAREMAEMMRDVGFAGVDVGAAWTMRKKVEKFEGEFGDGGVKPEMGEMMDFPFVLCYGERPM